MESLLSYRVVKNYNSHVQCLEKQGKLYVIKFLHSKELVENNRTIYRAFLPQLTNFCKTPMFVEGGDNYFIMTCESGKTYTWDEELSEFAGGRGIKSLDNIDIILKALLEIRQIGKAFGMPDVVRITKDRIAEGTKSSINLLKGQGLIIKPQVDKFNVLLTEFLSEWDNYSLSVSNRDFQFRNFLFNDQQLTVIDWEYARVSGYETEHCVSFLWLLMWNNPLWQQSYLGKAKEIFKLDKDKMRVVFLLDALWQATVVWFYQPLWRQRQIDYFLNILGDSYYQHMWGT